MATSGFDEESIHRCCIQTSRGLALSVDIGISNVEYTLDSVDQLPCCLSDIDHDGNATILLMKSPPSRGAFVDQLCLEPSEA